MKRSIESLLHAAVQAPSGDNMQPWRFAVDEAGCRLDLIVDETRDVSPMNAGLGMSRIAVGAALENVLQVAAAADLPLEPAPPPAGSLASLSWKDPLPDHPLQISPRILDRVTNRRPFDGRSVAAETLAGLSQQLPGQEGTQTLWVAAPDQMAHWADLIGRADGIMFGEPTMRAAFMANVRFDAPPDAEVEEGLSLASLELGAADRVALRILRRTPNSLVRIGGAGRFFAAHARKLLRSSAGLCLVAAPDSSPQTDLRVGRATQRAWLALTAAGLAVQPMMSLVVLDNALRYGSPELIASLGRDRLEGFRQEWQARLPELQGARLAFLMRFGYAPPPTGRVGRLPLAASVVEHAAALPPASP